MPEPIRLSGKPFFELSYNSGRHYGQLYEGFNRLQQMGVLDYTITHSTNPEPKLLWARMNKQLTIYFDELDGLNWLDDDKASNLNYFKSRIKADFYFKRSYSEEIAANAPKDCKVYPLGLNLPFVPGKGFYRPLKERLRDVVRNNKLLGSVLKVNRQFRMEDLEFFPVFNENAKVMLLTRLWDPNEIDNPIIKKDREQINQSRIDCIRICRKTFEDRFIGGLQNDELSRKMAPDLILPFELTARENFIKLTRQSNICIATTGLHGSTGWRFAEFIAASRAIISEPLNYQVPGSFHAGTNYLEFTNADTLSRQIEYLLNNDVVVRDMMYANLHYYNNYLRPEMIILNALKWI